MKQTRSTLSDFASILDVEILRDEEAVVLTGGFGSGTGTFSDSNIGCNVDNCNCTPNNCPGGGPEARG